MKRTLISFAVLGTILGAVSVQAGGFDRSGQSTSVLFGEGNVVEFTSVKVAPSVTGTYDAAGAAAGGGVTNTKNAVPSYNMTNIGLRMAVNDDLSIAVIQDSPVGAEVKWTAGMFSGTSGKVNSSATTMLANYSVNDNVSIHGGLSSQSISAEVAKTGYTLSTTTDTSVGYVFGAAYEKPEIAMRVALSYRTKIKHTVTATENSVAVAPMEIISPVSINIEFQTGIAEDTLLFGSVRQAKWSQTEVKAPVAGVLVASGTDAMTYSLGLGRKINEQWSGALTYGFEKATGKAGTAFGPTDGSSKIGLGITYTADKVKVTLGMQKVTMGDTTIATDLSGFGLGTATTTMSGNTALVTAIKIGYKF